MVMQCCFVNLNIVKMFLVDLEKYLVLDVRRVSFNAIVSDQDLEEVSFV